MSGRSSVGASTSCVGTGTTSCDGVLTVWLDAGWCGVPPPLPTASVDLAASVLLRGALLLLNDMSPPLSSLSRCCWFHLNDIAAGPVRARTLLPANSNWLAELIFGRRDCGRKSS